MDLVDVTDLVPARDATWRDGDAFLAGGTWLFSEPQPGTTRLLDLHAFEWPPLEESADGLEIASTCTIAELAQRPEPLIRQCCEALLGSFKIWNTATVGGNVCLALPAAPMISLTAALDGICLLLGPDGTSRTVPVAEFVLGARRTALRPGEYLRSIALGPTAPAASRHAFRQISLTPNGRSAALVIGRVDDGVTITVTASVPRPVQVRFTSVPTPDEAVRTVDGAVAGRWYDDVHGHPRWRAAMTARLVAEVVRELST